MNITAVAFDVDGTLYSNALMYLRSIPFALAHVRLLTAYASARKAIRAIRPVSDFKRLESELVADRLGVSRREAARQVRQEIHTRWESVLDHVPLFPHVPETLRRLRACGLRLAVVSDFPVERKLTRLRLDGLFDCALWTEETGYLKPHPEPFLETAARLDVPIEQVLFVGNSYRYDVVGARAVGMHTAHLSRRAHAGSVADFTFSNYRELADWITSGDPKKADQE
jgi:putative hydrolase of the HAD superfamily